MKRKKIIFYTMAMIKGGAERTIANLSNYFINYYDIVIITNINAKVEYELDKRIKVICLDKINRINEKGIKKLITKTSKKRSKILYKKINEENPDLIIALLPEPSIRILMLKNKINIPIIISIRNHPNKEYYIFKSIRNFYLKRANSIVIQSNEYIKYFPNYLRNNIVVIPNYITDKFNLSNKYSTTNKIIISIGRLEKQKNHKMLIKSFNKLNNNYNDYKLYIYGSGKEENKLNKLINKYKLNNRVFLIKDDSNMINDLKKSTLFVLTSNYEGMPNSLLEAMSLNIPVISTNSTEVINEIIDNNVNGIITKKRNIRLLTKNIEELLNDKSRLKYMSKNSKNNLNVYRKENVIDKWNNLINDNLK